MKLLITGGAGYIGSHTCLLAKDAGHEVTIIDDLSSGHSEFIRDFEFIKCNLSSHDQLDHLLKDRHFDAIIHFAAKSLVSESLISPEKYYQANVVGTINLINFAIRSNIKKFIFSSTASVYGEPIEIPISEEHPRKPINTYGKSKMIIEDILKDISCLKGLSSLSLRYFNAAGAHPNYNIGEDHEPETHLIPLLLDSLIRDSNIKVYGKDYTTKDGTCIRDYVHVCDIANAHLMAINYLDSFSGFDAINLGSGNGFSVLEVISSAEKVANKSALIDYSERRVGDPEILIAKINKANNLLGWEPKMDLDTIIQTAWKWHFEKQK